jgi:hypothetical protein
MSKIPGVVVAILRQTAESESFRWIVERRHLTDAADAIEHLQEELASEKAYSASLREEMRGMIQANATERQVYGRD